jgi:cell division protein FtsB
MKEIFKEDVLTYHKKTQEELQSIQDSQSFISSKFDELLKSVDSLKVENTQLKTENINLKAEVSKMAAKITELEDGQEDLKLYSRRDCLEFHGIPEIVQQICNLIEVNIQPSDISVSHCLPARGNIRPIIAKFARRNVRDKVYSRRRRLRSFSSSNLGFSQTTNNLYINESLTPKAKELFYKVREFRKSYNFKYVWTRYGKCYLLKNDTDQDIASFT